LPILEVQKEKDAEAEAEIERSFRGQVDLKLPRLSYVIFRVDLKLPRLRHGISRVDLEIPRSRLPKDPQAKTIRIFRDENNVPRAR